MSRTARLLATVASFCLIAALADAQPASARDFPCYTCITECSWRQAQCDISCGGAKAQSCVLDTYEYCSAGEYLVTCQDDPPE